MSTFNFTKYIPHRGLWMKPSEIPSVRQEIKQKIPKLTFRDVRRAKLPLWKALIQEMYEDGYTKFAHYFQLILDKEKTLHRNNKIETKLCEKEELQIALVENFRIAENALRVDENFTMCLRIVFETAQYIESNFPDYKWLTKECFEIGLSLFKEYENVLNNEQESRLRYFYGKFCFEKLNSYMEASEQFAIASKLSSGTIWLITQDSIDYLHKDCCFYLGQSYFAEANRIFKQNLEFALKLTQMAIEALMDCNLVVNGADRERNLFIEVNLRRCQFLIQNSEYEETLEIHKKIEGMLYASTNSTFKCEFLLQQGICHLGLKNLPVALSKIKYSIKCAETIDLNYFKGLGLIEIAKIYSKNQETFNLAQNSLNQAKDLFQLINDRENLKKVNYFSAILKTQEILPQYIQLMKNADSCSCDMLKLCGWKNYLKPFWTEDDGDEVFYKCIFKEMKYIKERNFAT